MAEIKWIQNWKDPAIKRTPTCSRSSQHMRSYINCACFAGISEGAQIPSSNKRQKGLDVASQLISSRFLWVLCIFFSEKDLSSWPITKGYMAFVCMSYITKWPQRSLLSSTYQLSRDLDRAAVQYIIHNIVFTGTCSSLRVIFWFSWYTYTAKMKSRHMSEKIVEQYYPWYILPLQCC